MECRPEGLLTRDGKRNKGGWEALKDRGMRHVLFASPAPGAGWRTSALVRQPIPGIPGPRPYASEDLKPAERALSDQRTPHYLTIWNSTRRPNRSCGP